jgi:hypothetical protein
MLTGCPALSFPARHAEQLDGLTSRSRFACRNLREPFRQLDAAADSSDGFVPHHDCSRQAHFSCRWAGGAAPSS